MPQAPAPPTDQRSASAAKPPVQHLQLLQQSRACDMQGQKAANGNRGIPLWRYRDYSHRFGDLPAREEFTRVLQHRIWQLASHVAHLLDTLDLLNAVRVGHSTVHWVVKQQAAESLRPLRFCLGPLSRSSAPRVRGSRCGLRRQPCRDMPTARRQSSRRRPASRPHAAGACWPPAWHRSP